jgi:hypothetical protein
MKNFKKKPVTIQAEQITEENATDLMLAIGDGAYLHFADRRRTILLGIMIPTLEGEMLGSIGDYLIQGVEGEFYPCKEGIFKKTYDQEPGELRHVSKALNKYTLENGASPFISVKNAFDTPGVAPVVSFTIQSDPIGEVGVNGVQATDMLKYVKHLFESLNEAYSCSENAETLQHLKKAIHWQHLRTQDRKARQVEGMNAE